MPNVDRADGLRPARYLNGAPWNGAANKYFIPATDATAAYVGGVVKTAGSATADGVMHVTANCATGNALVGVIVGVDPVEGVTSPNLDRTYRPASTAMYIYVADDPNLLFEVQSDGTAGIAAVGEVADLTGFTSGSTTTGRSAIEISNATITNNGDQTEDVLIVAGVNRPDNDITLANGRYLVRLNNHYFVDGADGSGV